jgi:hypothetical protein
MLAVAQSCRVAHHLRHRSELRLASIAPRRSQLHSSESLAMALGCDMKKESVALSFESSLKCHLTLVSVALALAQASAPASVAPRQSHWGRWPPHRLETDEDSFRAHTTCPVTRRPGSLFARCNFRINLRSFCGQTNRSSRRSGPKQQCNSTCHQYCRMRDNTSHLWSLVPQLNVQETVKSGRSPRKLHRTIGLWQYVES